MKNRRKSRELALLVLYAYEVGMEKRCDAIFNEIIHNPDFGDYKEEEVRAYALSLVSTVVENQKRIDDVLQKHTANWEIGRMTAVDRNILRMAACELEFSSDVPYKVIIDEAVEIAKRYGTEESGKFVNGIIDAVTKELRSRKDTFPDGSRGDQTPSL